MAKSTPEISVNKLAEFVNATESRKRSILKTIKSDDVEARSQKNRYATAKSAIINFMIDENHDLKIFEQKRIFLVNKKPDTTHKKNDILNSLTAIKKLEQLAQTELVPYLRFNSKNGLPKNLRRTQINNVLIHLSPEIIFSIKDQIKGAMKLVFSKSRPITPMEGQIIAVLISRFLQKNFKVTIQPKNCFVVDVFANRLFPTPDSFKYYGTLLRKAYYEINKLWPTIN